MRIKASEVTVKRSDKTAKSIKADNYLKSITTDKLQSVNHYIKRNKGVEL